ncbi:MAG TPA: hypothetical protein PKD32_11400 [Saprospiraceae bacterium]|nr:hypothetical protein [Saprospiraceae bacterium]
MDKLDNLIDKLDVINLVDFFKYWESNQDVFIVKYDGERSENKYTMMIMGFENRFDMIRFDCDDFRFGIKSILLKYSEILDNCKEY